jgi:hypothetical protein
VSAVLVLLVSALTAGAVGQLLLRRRRRSKGAVADPIAVQLRALGFELSVGDVVTLSGQDVWLESAWLLCEANEGVALLLFADTTRLLCLPRPGAELFRLRELPLPGAHDGALTLEWNHVSFARAGRRPVSVTALGAAPAPPANSGVWAEYTASKTERIWVLAGSDESVVLHGKRLDALDVERLGGGAATLHD